MNKYNFDNIIDRRNTNCVKYDLTNELFGSDNLIPMWVADMDFNTPPFILKAIEKRVQHPILGYSFRPDSYNNSISFWLNERYSWEVKSEQISFSPGVVSGLMMAMTAFTNPGDKVIVQPPVYFPFFTTIKENNRELVYNPLIEKNGYYSMDFDNLKSIIDNKTKSIFISNPHNPVGRAWKKEELQQLVEICYSNDIMIFSDEIHSDFVFKPYNHTPLASVSKEAAQITVTIMAPSKTFNMAGLSTSFVVIKNKKNLMRYNKELESYHLRQGNIFGTVATEAAYSEEGAQWVDELIEYINENIDYVCSFINANIPQIGIRKPESTYLLWLNMKAFGFKNKELSDFFTYKVKIGVNKGVIFGPGGNGYIRINVATSKAVVKEAMTRLKKAIDLEFGK
jgi:cystathionine beta-lyase